MTKPTTPSLADMLDEAETLLCDILAADPGEEQIGMTEDLHELAGRIVRQAEADEKDPR